MRNENSQEQDEPYHFRQSQLIILVRDTAFFCHFLLMR